MSVLIDGNEKRIGLALSGGGFRAAAFHLGTFRKLDEFGLLTKVDLLSCVSGGSIAGAFLSLHWNDPDVLGKLETYLLTKSIGVSSAIGGLLNPFASRLDLLANTYDRDLFNNKTMKDLKNGPRIYINSTNLSTGNMFFFTSGESKLGKTEDMGDHELGQVSASDIKISEAVAASSAFPPVFPPLLLDEDRFPNDQANYVTLTDGGVYDNLGVNPLLRMKRNDLQYAIVSDGGKPFEVNSDPTESSTIVLKEAINILMEQVRGLQFKRLELSHRADGGPKPMWYSVDSVIEDDAQTSIDARFASMISTNLKRLSEEELTILTRHASALCEARIKKYAPELIT